MANGGVSTK